MKELILNANDGYPLAITVYEVKNPKAVIQCFHGMEEYQLRYKEFAEACNKAGFTVVTADMRGHGKNAIDLGHFANKNGYKLLLSDAKQIREFISTSFPGVDVYLFGHSMGTILSRVLLQTEAKQYKKVCLSGYPCYTVGAKIGLPIVNTLKFFRGPKYKSHFVQGISVDSFNGGIKNPRTNIDWLSYNEENVDKYAADPLCGFGFTVSAFKDLFKLVIAMHKHKNYKDIDPETPFLMVHGEEDPCVGGKKGSDDSISTLKKAGFKNLTEISYPHMRHEILNEDNKDQVKKDIVEFFSK